MRNLIYESLLDIILDEGPLSFEEISNKAYGLNFPVDSKEFKSNLVLAAVFNRNSIAFEKGKYRKKVDLVDSSKALLDYLKNASAVDYAIMPWLFKLRERLELKYGSS